MCTGYLALYVEHGGAAVPAHEELLPCFSFFFFLLVYLVRVYESRVAAAALYCDGVPVM